MPQNVFKVKYLEKYDSDEERPVGLSCLELNSLSIDVLVD